MFPEFGFLKHLYESSLVTGYHWEGNIYRKFLGFFNSIIKSCSLHFKRSALALERERLV